MADNHNNIRQPVSSTNRTKGAFPYYGASGIVDYISEYIFDEPRLLIGEDGAKWGAFEKTAFIARGKYWVNNHAHVFSSRVLDIRFLENYLMLLDLAPFVTGFAPPKLTLDNAKRIPIPVPSNSAEQQKIADCLSAIDALITAQTEQIAALKEHKKGLMQKLFPNPDLNKA
ncbi:MAG: type I restriction endonuclease subunit S [Verrucomicrobia bacterium]|nr:type I restriction endonuclease subunit S [Verrucomicrobiota bacterium]